MRLRRELLTRAVHTESRRLILWRACKGRNIKSLFSHTVLIHTSYQGLLHRTSLALWDCWTSQDKSKSFPTFVVIIYHFATFFARGGQSLASVFALIRSEVVDGCSGRSRWPTKKMRSSSQLIIFVMHKNCAFHSLAAFFYRHRWFGPRVKRNNVTKCTSRSPPSIWPRMPIVSDDALKGTAVVLSKSQLQALPTVVCCRRLAIMMGWTFHHG